MKSIKTLIQLLISLIIFIIVFSILFNVFYVQALVNEIDTLRSDINKLDVLYLEMELPVRVLKNISDQVSGNEKLTEDEINPKLEQAFKRNKDKIFLHLDQMKGVSSKINSSLIRIDRYLLFSFLVDMEELANISDEISDRLNILDKEIELEIKQQKYWEFNFSSIQNTDVQVKIKIGELVTLFPEKLEKAFKKYLLINNAFLVLLFMMLIIFAVFLMKVVLNNYKYILKGYDLLDNYNYDVKKLPTINTFFHEEVELEEIVSNVIKEQALISSITSAVSKEYVLEETLESLFKLIEKELNIDRIGVAFVNYSQKKIIAEYGSSNYGNILLDVGFEVGFENTSLTNIIESKKPVINNDLLRQFKNKPKSRSLELITKEGIKSNIIYPLITDENVIGFLFFSSVKKNHFNAKTKKIGEKIAMQLASLLDKTYLTKRIFSEITVGFAGLVEKKDTETGEHLSRMVEYSSFIAKLLVNHPKQAYSVNKLFVRDIENHAAVHDIGKVGIPDSILKKPDKLSKEEWEIMKKHPTIGGDIFSSLKEGLQIFEKDFFSVAENITRYHHEKWDGSGYPENLKADKIPLEARIVAIADVFDALTSKRSYKEAYSFEKSFNILKDMSGSHLDPNLMKILEKNIDKFKKLYKKYH